MKTGMLWQDDNPDRKLEEKVALAVVHYRKTRGRLPTHCYINKTQLDHNKVTVPKITILPSTRKKPVLLHHFWIGVEDERQTSHKST